MSLRIFFPSNNYLADLTKNYNFISAEIDLVRIGENENIIDLLNNNEVDLALIDPLTYSSISGEYEFAIVPTKCLVAAGYTGIASIYFAKYLREIESIAFDAQNKYFALLTSIILKEKYSFETQITELTETSIKDLKNFDAIISTNQFEGYNNSLDFTEEWFDTFEFPLPIAFWVAPEHYDYDTITKITELLYDINKTENEITDVQKDTGSSYEQEGMIINQFSDEIIKYLEEIIQLFFQLGLIENMKDIRILGSEDIN